MTAKRPRRVVLYPTHYMWYLIAATLDVVVTHFILAQLGGSELNTLADRLIERYGSWGLVSLKYSTVFLVVIVCESVGRRRPRTGQLLATFAVVISALPVGLGLLHVVVWTHRAA